MIFIQKSIGSFRKCCKHKNHWGLLYCPALFARALKNIDKSARVTIGNDKGTADEIEKLGSQHEICTVDDFIVDEENKIVSTPAYMLASSISEAASGIEKLVKKILEWV